MAINTINTASVGGGTATPRMTFSYSMETLDAIGTSNTKYDEVATGTGNTVLTDGGYQLKTGTTDGSSELLRAMFGDQDIPALAIFDENPELQGTVRLINATANNSVSMFAFGTMTGALPDDAGAFTTEHMGFILDVTVLDSSSSDNTTQQTTDISSGITMTSNNVLRAVEASGTDIKFYVNNALEATHSTRIMSGSFGVGASWAASVDLDGGVTTDKNIVVGHVTIAWDAE